jgi:hypothetical protein
MYLHIYLPTHPSINLPTYLPIKPPTYHLPTCLFTYPPTHPPIYLHPPTYLPTYYIPSQTPTYLLPITYLPTHPPTHPPTYLPTYPQHQNVTFTLQKSSHMCHLRLELTTWLPSPNDHIVNPTSRISPNHINDYSLPWLQLQRT